MSINYKLLSGTLPPQFALENTGSKAVVNGFTQMDTTLFSPPLFGASTDLGAWVEKTSVSTDLQVTAQNGANLAGIAVISGYLPWGLFLNQDGTITGTAAELLDRTSSYFSTAESPKWNSSANSFTIDVETTQNFSIADATSMDDSADCVYYIVDGALPYGLTMSSTGVISGSPIVPYTNAFEDVKPTTPVPSWTVPAGLLGNWNEHDNVSIQLSATPNLGTSIVAYTIVKGGLPFGITLAPNGLISGVAFELYKNQAQYVDNTLPPVFDTNPITFTHGVASSFAIVATPTTGRSIVSYELIDSVLPFGLNLNPTTGVISGTTSNTANYTVTGSYQITIRATDNTGSWAVATYTLQVQ